MKLVWFTYDNPDIPHPLNGFDKQLRHPTSIEPGLNPICLVGINGSGKSKLLECLAEIFEYLTGCFTDFVKDPGPTNIQFRLDYIQRAERRKRYVRFEQNQERGKPICLVGNDEKNLKALDNLETIRDVLPEIVLAILQVKTNR